MTSQQKESFTSVTPKASNAFTERGSVQTQKINFFSSKNMAVYEANKRVKSPAPRAFQQMTTARKKVQASNVKYEPARRDKEANRNNRKAVKGHTLNVSKMPDAV